MLVDDSTNPVVREAYEALALEVDAQWHFAVANGIAFEPSPDGTDPYKNSIEMVTDVLSNRHLYFYQGGEPHPFMSPVDPQTFLSLTDKFRAIHDYFGYAASGYGFGPRGEENAWYVHSQMFSWEARRALTTETRGQNCWVNFGRHNFGTDGQYLHLPLYERPFAPQKTAILPDEFVRFPSGRIGSRRSVPSACNRLHSPSRAAVRPQRNALLRPSARSTASGTGYNESPSRMDDER